MKTRIIPIGNSHGIRIPKLLLEQAGLKEEVEITASNSCLTIRPISSARAGWAEAFQAMAKRGDDALLDDVPNLSNWDEQEWEW
jgi:antitoxin MazE